MARTALAIIAVLALGSTLAVKAQQSIATKPLRDSEVLALVGGNVLPETIVTRLNTSGLDFTVGADYRGLLKKAGAMDIVIAAVEKARVAPANSQTASSPELLQQLAVAGELASQKKYDEAIEELDSSLAHGNDGPETGFVLGRILVEQQRYDVALAVYSEVLRRDPAFPEVHTKLSFLYHASENNEEGLKQARIALREAPDDAEAHKNAGLSLGGLQKYAAAKAEYSEALRIKPKYEAVHLDLGILYEDMKDIPAAIAEYKIAAALNPNDVDAHYYLGNELHDKGDMDAAIHEYRVAKQLDPDRFDIRQNLSSTLMDKDIPAAITELREMEAKFPEESICHECLGNALYHSGDLNGAKAEYDITVKLDPDDSMAHVHVGMIAEQRGETDTALREYLRAVQLDDTNSYAHESAGEILLYGKHDASTAISELKKAEDLQPSDAAIHQLYGEALNESGNTEAAISEFKESVSLDPNAIDAHVQLAKALEKNHEWAAALAEYRTAALAFAVADQRVPMRVGDSHTPQENYEAAQKRFQQFIAQLKSSGKADEAAAIEKSVNSTGTNASLSSQMDDAMLAGTAAVKNKQPEEATHRFEIAVKLGEQVQPHDIRLIRALEFFGKQNLGIHPDVAQGSFEHELKVVNELYGDNAPVLEATALELMGDNAFSQKRYETAVTYYTRSMAKAEKAYGENSMQLGNQLRLIARVYEVQNHYEKAEPFLQRELASAEITGESTDLMIALGVMEGFYENWGKQDKVVELNKRLIALMEKTEGPNSPMLAQPLLSEEKALRALGRGEEADQIEQRVKLIQASASKMNQ